MKKKFLTKKTIIIMAGGTGGHIFPALVVAKYFEKLGYSIHWIGTKKSMESKEIPKYGFNMSLFSFSGLRGKNLLTLLISPINLFKSILLIMNLFRKIKPLFVLGMGGYASGPGGLASIIMRIPLIIHEQNSIAGLTNRILSKYAKRVLTAFPTVFEGYNFDSRKIFNVGNPVRLEFENSVKTYIKNNSHKLKLLITGGSLGAKIFNDIVPFAVDVIKQQNPLLQINIWHQIGYNEEKNIDSIYKKNKIRAKVECFIENISDAFNWCDIVIARSGALTISELTISGRASILVPYPYAVDDHQTKNSEYLVNNNAAISINQKNFDVKKLVSVLQTLINENQRIQEMADAAKKLGKKGITKKISDLCFEVVNAR